MSDAIDAKRAMSASTELLASGEYERAMHILDQAIKDCLDSGGERSWTRTLCHHAAIIADFAGRPDLVKGYYEQSLAFDPENARALYGLARVYLELGEAPIAEKYARRCYDAAKQGTDSRNRIWLELIAKRWPQLTA